MDFALTDAQQQIREEVLRLCARFDDTYWLERENTATFPHGFFDAMAAGQWLGIAMPEEYGGAGLGITEAAIMAQAVAESGAAMSGASAIHINIFGLNPVVVYGTAAQKARMLPPLIEGRDKSCFGVTEPNAGLNTTEITTRADLHGDHYRINGTKIWTSTAQVANKILLLARTTPLDRVKRKSQGMTLFYTDLDKTHAEVRLIHKMGRHAVDSNMVFFEDMRVPVEDRIGEEGEGFRALLHGLNPERVLIAAEAVGIGRAALARAARYGRERVVFGRPIGQNQGIQHPLAKNWAELEAANLTNLQGGMAVRRRAGMRRRSECRKISRCRSRLSRSRASRPDSWRDGLCAGVSRRAPVPGKHVATHRTCQPGADPELSGRARTGFTKIYYLIDARRPRPVFPRSAG